MIDNNSLVILQNCGISISIYMHTHILKNNYCIMFIIFITKSLISIFKHNNIQLKYIIQILFFCLKKNITIKILFLQKQ